MKNVCVFPDAATLNDAVAERILELARHSVEATGRFTIALAGGSTPRLLYERLAVEPYRSRIPWQQVQVFFGDERTVSPAHSDSNFRMAKEALLNHVPLPESNIHRMAGEKSPEQAAQEYETTLRQLFDVEPDRFPRLDVILLGMGPDGHIASLFPGTAALGEHDKWVTAVHVESLNTWRISLTFPVLNHARNVMLLVTGAGKREMVENVLGGKAAPGTYPVQRLSPYGALMWYLDKSAAESIRGNI